MTCCVAACLGSHSTHWSTSPPRLVVAFTWNWSPLEHTSETPSSMSADRDDQVRSLRLSCRLETRSRATDAISQYLRRELLQIQACTRRGDLTRKQITREIFPNADDS